MEVNKVTLGVTAGAVVVGFALGYALRKGKHAIKYNKKSYSTKDPYLTYVLDHSLRLTPEEKELTELTRSHPKLGMLSSADQMQFLKNLVKLIGAKKTLDIGVFTGYSSMAIASVLPPDGIVVACDINDDFVKIGKPIWKKAGLEHKIDLRLAPALETLQNLLDNGEEGTFDYAFIDADKTNYDNYYEMCLKLLRKGGVIAVDNVMWGGRVINEEDQTKDTVAIRKLNDKLVTDSRIDISMLTVGDGTTLAFKL